MDQVLSSNALMIVVFILGSIIHYIFWCSPRSGDYYQRIFCPVFTQQYHDCCSYPAYFLMRESRNKDLINEQLNSAYLQAQLQLLQEQLNPHFLFNTLSSLSAIVGKSKSGKIIFSIFPKSSDIRWYIQVKYGNSREGASASFFLYPTGKNAAGKCFQNHIQYQRDL
jgi:hypothetical protein